MILIAFLLPIIILLLMHKYFPIDADHIGKNFAGYYNKEKSICNCKKGCKCRVSKLIGKPKPLGNKKNNNKLK